MPSPEKLANEKYIIKRQSPEATDQIIMEQSNHFRTIFCLHYGESGPYITEHFPMGMDKDELNDIYKTMISVEDISIRDLLPDSDITIEKPSSRRTTIITNIAAITPDIQITYVWKGNEKQLDTQLQMYPYHASRKDPNYDDILEWIKTADKVVIKRLPVTENVTSS